MSGRKQPQRPPKDAKVEARRPVIDVPDVELDPLLPRYARPPVHLCPSREPRLDLEAPALARRVEVDLRLERRARTDDCHVAPQDVDEVRDLIQREPAQHTARRGDAGIPLEDR